MQKTIEIENVYCGKILPAVHIFLVFYAIKSDADFFYKDEMEIFHILLDTKMPLCYSIGCIIVHDYAQWYNYAQNCNYSIFAIWLNRYRN